MYILQPILLITK